MAEHTPDINALFNELLEQLPQNLAGLNSEIQTELKRALSIALGKMDLVTRHEFDIQKAVLQRSREKLEKLEKQVVALEAELLKQK